MKMGYTLEESPQAEVPTKRYEAGLGVEYSFQECVPVDIDNEIKEAVCQMKTALRKRQAEPSPLP